MGFKNPNAQCSLIIIIFDSITRSYSTKMATFKEFNVIPDSQSVVGGTSALTVEFVPSAILPKDGFILLSSTSLKPNQEDCVQSVTLKIGGNASSGVRTCTISGNEMKVRLSLEQDLQNGEKVALEHSGLKYNDMMAPYPLTLKTGHTNTESLCGSNPGEEYIESATNSADWTPTNPAKLQGLTLTFTPADVFTCDEHEVVFDFLPSITISQGHVVAVGFSGRTEVGRSECAMFQELEVVSGENKVKGAFVESCFAGFSCSFTIKRIKMGPVAEDLEVTIETYTQSESELVYRGSIIKPIKAKEHPGHVVIDLSPNPSKIWAESSYSFKLAGLCGKVEKASYSIVVPSSIFKNTANPVKCSPGEDLSDSENNTVSFELVNPPWAISGSDMAAEEFLITVFEEDVKAFTVRGQLNSNAEYEHGNLALSVVPGSATTLEECEYEFVIVPEHHIPLAGQIVLTLNEYVGRSGNLLITDTDGRNLSYAENNSKITITMRAPTDKGQELKITIANLRNPPFAKVYKDFAAASQEVVDGIPRIIDETGTSSSTITIAEIKEVGVNGILSSYVNLENATYTFTFLSNLSLPIANTEPNYLAVKLPSKETNCDLSNKECTKDDMCFEATSSPVTVSFTCVNPATTASTGDFTFTLYSKDEEEMMNGKQSVQTTTGAELENSKVDCSNNHTASITSCSISFTRKSNTSIKFITLYNENLEYSSSECGVFTSLSISANCSFEFSPRRIELHLDNPQSILMNIHNITLRNPTDKSISIPFSITTYTDTNAKVDEHINFVSLTVPCEQPCKTCESDAADCTSCIENYSTGEQLYLYPDAKRCEDLVGSGTAKKCNTGYYPDHVNFMCLKCNTTKCEECADNENYCTKCPDPANYLANGNCYSSGCPDGTYQSTGTTCDTCDSSCETCATSATKCTACKSGTYLHSDFCVAKCPTGTFGNGGNECEECGGDCSECVGSAMQCAACKSPLYLLGDQCYSKDACQNGSYIANDTAFTCDKCSSNCLKCKDTTTTCTECDNPYSLHNDRCISDCPDGYYSSSNKCMKCAINCETCESDTKCTSCVSTTYYVVGKFQCVVACEERYYVHGRNCIECHSSCNTCDGSSKTSCLSCNPGEFLYGKSCYGSCPGNTYEVVDRCLDCEAQCNGCKGTSSTCIGCAGGYYLYNQGCFASCPEGKLPNSVSFACDDCSSACRTCSGTASFCTSCHQGLYLYGGQCHSECPNQTAPNIHSNTGSCIGCEPGCDVCTWGETSASSPKVCVKCNWNYKYLDGTCVSVCPNGYKTSSDGLSCTKIIAGDDSSDKDEEGAGSDFLPFPHLIAAVLLGIVAAAGQYRDGRALLVPNLIIVLNYVTIVSYVFQTVNALSKNESLLAVVSAVVVAVQVLLNLLFLIPYKRSISGDSEFEAWGSSSKCVKCTVLILGTALSLQSYRLLYSRFMGFSALFANFADYGALLNPVNVFSLLQIVFMHCVLVIANIFALAKLSWGTNLYISLIESLILSFVLLVLLCYELLSAKTIKAALERDKKYSSLNDQATVNPELEKNRKRALQKIFDKLFGKDRKKPRRRHSFGQGTKYDKETDPRRISSFPSSPRTARERSVPLKDYGIDEDKVMAPEELPDAVCAESVPRTSPSNKPCADFSCQSPTFIKIEAFKKHLRSQGYKWKKMFENPLSLEVIPETPDEHEDPISKLRSLLPPVFSAFKPSFAEEDKPKGAGVKRPSSPPQITEEEFVFMTKPLNPIVGNEFDYSNETMMKLKDEAKDLSIIEKPSGVPEAIVDFAGAAQTGHKEAAAEFVSDEDILGEFDKDPMDGCILIRENAQGELVDLKNRTVNKYGYLIDELGNVVNQRGEIVMTRKMFDKEIEASENPRPTTQNNPLFKNAEGEQLESEKAEDFATRNSPAEKMETAEAKNDADERKSISLDTVMKDSPSNYNVQNQRYEGPSIGMQGTVQGYGSVNSKEALSKIYGANPAPKKRPHVHNKSSKKRSTEKIFQNVKKKESASEIKGGMNETTKDINRNPPSLEEEKMIQLTDEFVKEQKNAAMDNNDEPKLPVQTVADFQTMVYNDNTQGVLVASDVEDVDFVQLRNNPIVSHSSIKSGRVKGLESIYLQKLEEPSTRLRRKHGRKNKSKMKKRVAESEAARDKARQENAEAENPMSAQSALDCLEPSMKVKKSI